MLRDQAGWVVNDKRVERIWRREGLKGPQRQSKRGRLWLLTEPLEGAGQPKQTPMTVSETTRWTLRESRRYQQ